MDSFAKLPKGMQHHVVVGTEKIMSSGKAPFESDCIIDIGSSQPYFVEDITPTLTAPRCSQLGYWSTKRFRRLSVQEMMRLQGADFVTLHGWEQVISEKADGGDRRE